MGARSSYSLTTRRRSNIPVMSIAGRGQWLRCLDTLKKSLEQDPRNADVAGNLAQTYCILRMWQDAERAGKYALNIDPADVIGMRALLLAILNGSGDIKERKACWRPFRPRTILSRRPLPVSLQA